MKGFTKHFTLLLLVALAGVLGALGMIAFKLLLAIIHNFVFSLTFSWHYPETQFSNTRLWGGVIFLLPILGSLPVTWLLERYAPKERGLSVPQIIAQIHYHQGYINVKAALAKVLAAVLSIATGGSVGREGPIIQFSAALNTMVANVANISHEQRIVLIACGVAAGTAATFDAPIAGVVFASELLLVTMSVFHLFLLTLAVVMATLVTHALNFATPIFTIPYPLFMSKASLSEQLLVLPLALIVGLYAVVAIKSLFWIQKQFQTKCHNPYWRHALGMCGVGLLCSIFYFWHYQYYVEGIGFSTIQSLLMQTLSNPWLLLSISLAKCLATALTLGSGASGGVFSPALFMGATIGACYAGFLQVLFPTVTIDLLLCILCAMAAMLASVTGVVVTGMVLILELTNDWRMAGTVLICVLIASWVRSIFSKETLYNVVGVEASTHGSLSMS